MNAIDELLPATVGAVLALCAGVVLWLGLVAVATLAGVTP
jgi:hypothetical protein